MNFLNLQGYLAIQQANIITAKKSLPRLHLRMYVIPYVVPVNVYCILNELVLCTIGIRWSLIDDNWRIKRLINHNLKEDP